MRDHHNGVAGIFPDNNRYTLTFPAPGRYRIRVECSRPATESCGIITLCKDSAPTEKRECGSWCQADRRPLILPVEIPSPGTYHFDFRYTSGESQLDLMMVSAVSEDQPAEANPIPSMRGEAGALTGLHDLCQSIKNRRLMVEVGTFAGESASLFAEYFDHIICVDPYLGGYYHGSVMQEAKKELLGRIEGARNISFLHMPSLQAARVLRAATIDFVYIDGDHTFQSVSADINAWSHLTEVLGGHDFNIPDVRKAVLQIADESNVRTFVDTSWTIGPTN